MKGTFTLSNKFNFKVDTKPGIWDKRFLKVAAEVATWSKDPSTKVGAIAVKDKKVIAQGYNGFPKGIKDLSDRYNDREIKYKYIVHAEMNVIYNAAENGVSLRGSNMYVYGLPACSDCARGIIQVGVKRVIMPKQGIPDKWKESWEMTVNMFDEANVIWNFVKL